MKDPLEMLSRELDALGRGLAHEKAVPMPAPINAVVRQRRSRWMAMQIGVGSAIGTVIAVGLVGAVALLNASPKDGPFVKPQERPKVPWRERMRDHVPMAAPSSMASLRRATKGTEGAAMLEKLPATDGVEERPPWPLQREREK